MVYNTSTNVTKPELNSRVSRGGVETKHAMKNSAEDRALPRIVKCPACGTSTRYDSKNTYRPFCSERCRLVDLGQWLEEDYRVAGDSAAQEPIEGE